MMEKGFPRRWEVLAVLLITLLAAALRFYRLPDVPPGLHYDEGFKGVTARALLQGAPLRLYFESDMGEEPMAIYLVAASLGLGGQEPWLVRLPSAIIGVLTIPLAWWLGRELLTWLQRTMNRPQVTAAQIVGLGTALALAILYWHLSFSRIGLEPILVPFCATLAFAALARGLHTGKWPACALAGLALGGSLYTYKAGYFVPVVAFLLVAYAAVMERGFLRRHGRSLLLVALVTLLVAAPIGLYFLRHPAGFWQRPASVALTAGKSATESSWQALAANLSPVLGMFFVRGDANPRSNLPGRPALDPFLALLFLAGLGRALAGFRRPPFALLLIWLAVMIVPTLLSEDAPHFGRAIGATPAVALLCALGGWTLWQGAAQLGRRWIGAAAAGVLAVGIAFSGASTAWAYFHTWGRSPDLFYAYDVGLVDVAAYVNTLPAGEEVYLTPTPRSHFTLQFLVRRPLASFDGRAGLVFPSPGHAATIVALLREDETTLPALQRVRPDGTVTWTLDDNNGHPYTAAYYLPASDRPAPLPDHVTQATLGADSASGRARLLGYSLDPEVGAPGDSVYLTLYWQALTPFGDDYTVFTHLLGDHNPETGSPLWGGHDGQPDGGHYPTSVWQPDQVILDVHPLTIPINAPPGNYRLEAGLYHLATMARLPAADTSGHPLPDDAVPLGNVEVRE
jgi:4-amino-4-deoxy-L-arabinose transferase-like glycosyltransferase